MKYEDRRRWDKKHGYQHQKNYIKKHPEKMVEYQKKYAQANKDKIAERKKEYERNNLEKIREYRRNYNMQHKERARDLRLKRKFNLSLEKVGSLLIQQQHKCPICEKNLKEIGYCVDHDHNTGRVRGILCRKCNVGIGFLQDNPLIFMRAIKYLETQKAVTPQSLESKDRASKFG